MQQQQDDNNSNDNNARSNLNIIPFECTLSTCPRDLFALWEEYKFGLGGRKPAERFTRRERGNVKYKFHRRKVFWDRVSEMIRGGHTYHTAIDELYRIYGQQKPVTDIINEMRDDRKRQLLRTRKF